MDLTIEQTILVNRYETARQDSAKDKVIFCLCCFRPKASTLNANRSTKKLKKRSYSKVRFKEPNKVEPVDARQPSWESYQSWTSNELDDALEEFISETLLAVKKSLDDDSLQ